MNPQPQVVAKGLRKAYPSGHQTLVVLDRIDLNVAGGESVAVMGPSGSGKSTLLHILGTLERPTDGTVRLAGRDPFELNDRDLSRFRNRTIGFVFQDHHLLPQCTALENVLVPTLAARGDRAAAARRAQELLEQVGLADRTDHRPADLSGGERQRVAIARALIHEPAILLCDEPTGNLDTETGRGVADTFQTLQKEQGVALIVATHDADFAARFDRLLRLREGTLQA